MYQPNTDALYHGTINDATRELARLVYELAKAHDVPYVTACAFRRTDDNWGMASAQNRNGEYTDGKMYYPDVVADVADVADEEDSTDGQDI